MKVEEFVAKFSQYPEADIVVPNRDHSLRVPVITKDTAIRTGWSLSDDYGQKLGSEEIRIGVIRLD